MHLPCGSDMEARHKEHGLEMFELLRCVVLLAKAAKRLQLWSKL